MKQIIFFLSLLVMASFADAQQYSCIPAEHKTFFTNGSDYLRGMRIDSVKYDGPEKIYYPFRTARISLSHDGEYADTTGGSWWGSMIIEDTLNGITAIPTRYGDTVWIQTRAGLNDQWTFYRDTAVRYYEAKVISLDAVSIAGISDSVKTIRIIAKDGNTVVNSDSLNGLELLLSQHHGLLQAIGFYLFPYKGFDVDPDYYFSISGDSNSTNNRSHAELAFRRVPFHFPIYENIFDYDTGEVFGLESVNITTGVRDTTADTVFSKMATATTFSYIMTLATRTFPYGLMYDSVRMPEEWLYSSIWHYKYSDSSYCIVSPLYQVDWGMIDYDGYFDNLSVFGGKTIYKEKAGEVYREGNNLNYKTINRTLYIRNNKLSCYASNIPLGMNTTLYQYLAPLIVYPNPVCNEVTVSTKSGITFSVQILDLTGRLLIQQSNETGALTIPINNLPNGLYLLKVSSGNEMLTKKLSVLH